MWPGKPKNAENFSQEWSSALAAFVVSFTKHTHFSELTFSLQLPPWLEERLGREFKASRASKSQSWEEATAGLSHGRLAD